MGRILQGLKKETVEILIPSNVSELDILTAIRVRQSTILPRKEKKVFSKLGVSG